uniref:Agouti domain-containing protein n=1 Tax=Hippocampus comes TaxID=109280 RepID=A0A3Q2Z4C5_HIPCM
MATGRFRSRFHRRATEQLVEATVKRKQAPQKQRETHSVPNKHKIPLFVFQDHFYRSRAPEAWHDPAQVDEDNNEERGDFLMEAESYDQDGSASRAMRSARRCIRHQQSCLGFPLPCCDACDTCYCRFFNAICYCRRVGHACPSART